LHSKDGSGHLAHAGQGGHCSCLGIVDAAGHAGHTGGTISDFKIYKSSFPGGIIFFGMPCGNELHHNMSNTILTIMQRKNLQGIDEKLFHFAMYRVSRMVERTIHYDHIRRYIEINNYEATNRQYRIQYMMNEISESQLKILLQRNEKKVLKTNELRDVYLMLTNTAKDILFRFRDYIERLPDEHVIRETRIRYNNVPDPSNIGEPIPENTVWNANILKEMDVMIEYTNECFEDISKTYGCAQYRLSTNPYMNSGF
jgi:hypothetical protein